MQLSVVISMEDGLYSIHFQIVTHFSILDNIIFDHCSFQRDGSIRARCLIRSDATPEQPVNSRTEGIPREAARKARQRWEQRASESERERGSATGSARAAAEGGGTTTREGEGSRTSRKHERALDRTAHRPPHIYTVVGRELEVSLNRATKQFTSSLSERLTRHLCQCICVQ